MEHSLSKFFQKLRFDSNLNNSDYCESQYSTGKMFPIINPSYYKGLYKIDQIYITPWNELCCCYCVKQINKISDSIKHIPYYSAEKLESIYKSNGPFDINLFIPVCSLLLFHTTDLIQPRIVDMHLIHKNILYFYDKFGVYIKNSINNDTFSELNEFNLIFDPIYINEDYFNIALHSKLNKIQFILASCGYSKYLDQNGNIYPKDHSDIDSLEKLRALLLNSRQYSRLIDNKDIIHVRY